MTHAVTIAMPVYNGQKTVSLAIRSLLNQTFRDFELIISDNASSDETLAIVNELTRTDSRVRRFTRSRTTGAAEHFNDLFGLRQGKYFMWAACDDLWEPHFIEHTFRLLERHPEAAAALTQIALIDEEGTLLRVDGNMVAASSDIVERIRTIFNRTGWFALFGLMRPSMMQETKLYRPTFGGDVLFMADLLLKGSFAVVPAPLFTYRTRKREKSPAEYQNAIDPLQPLSPDPYTELAREVLNIVRSSSLDRLTVQRVEAMAIEELAQRNANWRLRIAREHGLSDFDRLPISARTVSLSRWLSTGPVTEASSLP